MQKISEFQGIQLTMEFSKGVPQVKAIYKNITGIFSIESAQLIDVLNGKVDDFPMTVERLTNAWILIHQDELSKNWQALEKDKNARLRWIAPLQ
jgi:hypothetical protein